MASLINTFLATGRLIREAERLLHGEVSDQDRARLGVELGHLMRRQQEQIVAAVNAGVSWDLVRFVLAFHGQDANRDQRVGEPTPAEQLGALFAQHGPDRVMAAIDAARSAAVNGVLPGQPRRVVEQPEVPLVGAQRIPPGHAGAALLA